LHFGGTKQNRIPLLGPQNERLLLTGTVEEGKTGAAQIANIIRPGNQNCREIVIPKRLSDLFRNT